MNPISKRYVCYSYFVERNGRINCHRSSRIPPAGNILFACFWLPAFLHWRFSSILFLLPLLSISVTFFPLSSLLLLLLLFTLLTIIYSIFLPSFFALNSLLLADVDLAVSIAEEGKRKQGRCGCVSVVSGAWKKDFNDRNRWLNNHQPTST